MSNYTKTTNFATKDSLPSGNAAKIVRGTEIDTEFNNIATASATKANSAESTFTVTVTAATVNVTGTLTADTITGGSYEWLMVFYKAVLQELRLTLTQCLTY